MSAPVVLRARAQHTATMIFLHGLGDTGHGWAAELKVVKSNSRISNNILLLCMIKFCFMCSTAKTLIWDASH